MEVWRQTGLCYNATKTRRMGTTNEPRTFGRLLRQQRLAASLTQEALAERAGLGLRSVQALESGTRLPLRETLEALTQALGLVSEQRTRLTLAAQPIPRRGPRIWID